MMPETFDSAIYNGITLHIYMHVYIRWCSESSPLAI